MDSKIYRIAAVDDKPGQRAMILYLFKTYFGKSVEVDPFENPDVALKAIQEKGKYYHLILADYQMDPYKNGLEFTKILKASNPNLAVIMISSASRTDIDIIDAVKNNELQGFINKDELTNDGSRHFIITIITALKYVDSLEKEYQNTKDFMQISGKSIDAKSPMTKEHCIQVGIWSLFINSVLRNIYPELARADDKLLFACLLHDIGKSIDHEVQGTHVEIGIKILQKFGLGKEIIDAMKPHHEDYPFETPESMIIAAADAISASRPGARKDSLESYLKRLEELEAVATSFPEVEKTYAIQAGREIRVFVKPDKIDDLGAIKLSRAIADKIEKELKYPGEIKVNVIRELRVTEFAR